ncbi:MAG: PLP-dependent transferase [Alicyclobacillus sp.]|nr:PLP-dependent transferase [Alicyclobacillus sp.]
MPLMTGGVVSVCTGRSSTSSNHAVPSGSAYAWREKRAVVSWLVEQPIVRKVYYPGLADHPGRAVHERQSRGYGGMVSFDVTDARMVPHILDGVQLITFAESLGGVESLITYPATQTHADIPKHVRDAVGVTDTLLRLSVGIEHVDDLIADLDQAFAIAQEAVSRQ